MAKGLFTFHGKALSVRQPWASAIAFTDKDVENREWKTTYRGPIAIHAGLHGDPDDLDRRIRAVRGGEKRTILDWINRGRKQRGLKPYEPDDFPFGKIVAIAMLVDCVEKSSSPWFGGKWGWVLQGVIPIEPITCKGRLGLWTCKFKYRPLA